MKTPLLDSMTVDIWEGNLRVRPETFSENWRKNAEKYKQYEYLKKHIAETSKTSEEYEARIMVLAEKLGV